MVTLKAAETVEVADACREGLMKSQMWSAACVWEPAPALFSGMD